MTKGGEFQANGKWVAPIKNEWVMCKECGFNIPKMAYQVEHHFCPYCGVRLKWKKGCKFRCEACRSGPCEVSAKVGEFVMSEDGLAKRCPWTPNIGEAKFEEVEPDD